MRAYTHIVGAVLFFVTFAYLTNLPDLLIGIFSAGWISVFPDIIDKITGKHRGIGHSIFWLIPFTIIGVWNFEIGVAMVIGFLSHILLDVMTTHGSPLLYPLRETAFVCFQRNRRVKTGTNQEKAVFLLILLFLIPILLFSTNIANFFERVEDENIVFATGLESSNSQKSSENTKNNFNFYFDIEDGVNKKITVQKVSENETTIMVTDIGK